MSETWTVRRVLAWTKGRFDEAHIDSPRLTAEILLGHVLGATRVQLYIDLDRPLESGELAQYRELIKRRLTGEPTQYLVGSTEFYGRRFEVDPRVLIPRPETELLVAAVLARLPAAEPRRVLDLCTGSGCIAVTIAAERPRATVWATDLSSEALEVARRNSQRLGTGERVTFVETDLWSDLHAGPFDVVVSNPPYVKGPEIAGLQREVQREPRRALDGGPDGLAVIRRIVDRGGALLAPCGLLALEIGDDQGTVVADLCRRADFDEVGVEKDLCRLDRLVLARAPRAAANGTLPAAVGGGGS